MAITTTTQQQHYCFAVFLPAGSEFDSLLTIDHPGGTICWKRPEREGTMNVCMNDDEKEGRSVCHPGNVNSYIIALKFSSNRSLPVFSFMRLTLFAFSSIFFGRSWGSCSSPSACSLESHFRVLCFGALPSHCALLLCSLFFCSDIRLFRSLSSLCFSSPSILVLHVFSSVGPWALPHLLQRVRWRDISGFYVSWSSAFVYVLPLARRAREQRKWRRGRRRGDRWDLVTVPPKQSKFFPMRHQT